MTHRPASSRFKPARQRGGLTLGAARKRMQDGSVLLLEYFKGAPCRGRSADWKSLPKSSAS